MKKLLFVFAIAAVGSLASCKKDYTCECTTTDSSGAFETVTTEYDINDAKKSDAEDACDGRNSSVGTLSTTCELQ